MVTKEHHLGKKELLDLIHESRGLAEAYKQEGVNGTRCLDLTNTDHVALDRFERQTGYVVVGIRARENGNINLLTRQGCLASDGTFFPGVERQTFVIEDYSGTTVSRFAYNAAQVVITRAREGHETYRAETDGYTITKALIVQGAVEKFM